MVKYWQRTRKRGSKQPPNTLYCGRPSRWGNPYREGSFVNWRAMTTKEAVMVYRYLVLSKRVGGDIKELLKYNYLSCWCKPGTPCHVQDVLIPLANGLKDADNPR